MSTSFIDMRKVNEVKKSEKQRKQAEKAEKAHESSENSAMKEQEVLSKAAEKLRLKEAEKLAKEAEKAEKLRLKEAEKLRLKEAEKLAKETEKAEKLRLKEAEKLRIKEAEKLAKEAVNVYKCKQKEKNIKKIQKNKKKFEVQTKTLTNLVPIAKKANQDYPDGFTAKQLTDMYIVRYGRINPYTLEAVDEGYDIHAAIRGIMEETSPSSAQHWFRYGTQKSDEQVAPWLFANKQLAIVNNTFGWKITTSEIAKARRQNKGKWIHMIEGGNARFDWPIEKYGPLPTEDLLKQAAIGRKVGVRGRKQES